MKRVAMLVCLGLCLSFSGCGGSEDPAPKRKPQKSAFDAPTASPIRTGQELERQIDVQKKAARDRRKMAEQPFEDR